MQDENGNPMQEVIAISATEIQIQSDRGKVWAYKYKGEMHPHWREGLFERQKEGWKPLAFAVFKQREGTRLLELIDIKW